MSLSSSSPSSPSTSSSPSSPISGSPSAPPKTESISTISNQPRPMPKGYEVILNVYDINPSGGKEYITSFNQFTKKSLGVGLFHSAVWIVGLGEYGYGCVAEGTGVFDCEPKKCLPWRYKFRESVVIGQCGLGDCEVLRIVNNFAQSDKFKGMAYDITRNNCNHFTRDLCFVLTGNEIPKWVNSAADALDVVRSGVGIAANAFNDLTSTETLDKAKNCIAKISLRAAVKILELVNHPRTQLAIKGTKKMAAIMARGVVENGIDALTNVELRSIKAIKGRIQSPIISSISPCCNEEKSDDSSFSVGSKRKRKSGLQRGGSPTKRIRKSSPPENSPMNESGSDEKVQPGIEDSDDKKSKDDEDDKKSKDDEDDEKSEIKSKKLEFVD